VSLPRETDPERTLEKLKNFLPRRTQRAQRKAFKALLFMALLPMFDNNASNVIAYAGLLKKQKNI